MQNFTRFEDNTLVRDFAAGGLACFNFYRRDAFCELSRAA
jgi:hypothetical protein